MKGIHLLDTVPTIRFLNQTDRLDSHDALRNHAVDEAVAIAVAKGKVPATIRCWRYDRSVMFGRRDMRLVDIDAAIEWVRTQGYDVAVRPCGGTCVPLDPGVLNISVILPAADYKQVSLNDGFQIMAQLIAAALQTYADVQAGEIIGSYCPGDYDLSISGYKIAGIAQRRIMGAVMIQAFLLIQGSGDIRFQFIQDMYERAGLHHTPEGQRPVSILRANSIRSLQESVSAAITPQHVSDLLLAVLQNHNRHVISETLTTIEEEMTHKERERFTKQLQLLCLQRYDVLKDS